MLSSSASIGDQKPHEQQADYQTVLTESELEQWVARLNEAPLISLDTETTSLEPMNAKLVGISFSVKSHCAAYVPLAHGYTGAPPQLPVDLVLREAQAVAGGYRQAETGAEPQVRQARLCESWDRVERYRS